MAAVADFGMVVAKVTPIDSNLKTNVKVFVWSLLAEVFFNFQCYYSSMHEDLICEKLNISEKA